MSMLLSPRRWRRAFTLLELMIGLGVFAAAGGMVFLAVRTVTLLGVKNGAINFTHQAQRFVLHRAVQEIHSSVSIPLLVDESLAPQSGNGPVAGVSYQTCMPGAHRVWAGISTGGSSMQLAVPAGATTPAVGMRVIVPAFGFEEDITAVSATGPTTYRVTFARASTRTIGCTSGDPNYTVHLTRREALVVVGGTLRHYTNVPGNVFTDVSPVQSATPFSYPGGDNRYVQADFELRDPSLNTSFAMLGTGAQLRLTVPYRCRLASRQ